MRLSVEKGERTRVRQLLLGREALGATRASWARKAKQAVLPRSNGRVSSRTGLFGAAWPVAAGRQQREARWAHRTEVGGCRCKVVAEA